MERGSQSPCTRLITQIAPQIWRANFYRLCQLLEKIAPNSPLIGSTDNINDDPIRFRPWAGMGFPAAELHTVEQHPDNCMRPLTIRTHFLGLYGIDSPLPSHYQDDITQHNEGTEALTEFLDIFNHRFITQYYRIWRKYAYPITFETGGNDTTSQCLFGLIGLGISGIAERINTPISRFLALLSTMRLPTRNSEGIKALISLLAPDTTAQVNEYDTVRIIVDKRSNLSRNHPIPLFRRAILGKVAKDTTSRILISLTAHQPKEARNWLSKGHLHTDFLALLRVYLGYRSDARITLTVPIQLLPEPRLRQKSAIQLGRNGLLGLKKHQLSDKPVFLTINLGHYQGLKYIPLSTAQKSDYYFD